MNVFLWLSLVLLLLILNSFGMHCFMPKRSGTGTCPKPLWTPRRRVRLHRRPGRTGVPRTHTVPPTQPDFTPTQVVPSVGYLPAVSESFLPHIPENVTLFNIASSSIAGGPRVAPVGRSVSSVGGVAFAEAPPVCGRIVGKKPPPSRRRITRKRPLGPPRCPFVVVLSPNRTRLQKARARAQGAFANAVRS